MGRCVPVYALMPPELGSKGAHTKQGKCAEVGSEPLCLGPRKLIHTLWMCLSLESAFGHLLGAFVGELYLAWWHTCVTSHGLMYARPSRGMVVYACLKDGGGPQHPQQDLLPMHHPLTWVSGRGARGRWLSKSPGPEVRKFCP